MSIYIKIRCPNCNKMGTYANDAEYTVVCDNCLEDINKVDGIIAYQKPPYTRLRNELRKRSVRN